jgi:hypothetical protein
METVDRNTNRSIFGTANVLAPQIIYIIKAFRASGTLDTRGNLGAKAVGTGRENGVATGVYDIPTFVVCAVSKLVAVITASVAISIFLILILETLGQLSLASGIPSLSPSSGLILRQTLTASPDLLSIEAAFVVTLASSLLE